MHSLIDELEEYIDMIGDLEGAPDHVIDGAKRFGRTLLFHVKPSMRVSPSEARDMAADWLRRQTNRYE